MNIKNKILLTLIYTVALVVVLSYNLFATNYYVDGRLLTGNNTGTSWDNAWRSFGAIVWSSIQPGDNIYISGRDTGGANDSTVYYEMLQPRCQGTITNRITIIAGKYSPSPTGHSGRVIIDGQAQTRDNCILFDDWYGTHTGANNASTLVDAEADFIPDALIGWVVRNVSDSNPPTIISDGVITDNTVTTITATLSGGIENDWDTGDAYAIDYNGTVTETESPRYVTVKGFELRQGTGGLELNIDDSTIPLAISNTIDSLYIYDWYDLAGIQVQGNADSLIVQNCRIVTFLNDGVQTDCFHFNGTDMQHARRTIIRNNVILNKNQDPLAHNDAIQSVIADGFIVYNNIIVNDSVYSFEGGGLPFILGSIDYHYNQALANRNPVILYNNFCYMGGVWYPVGNQGFTMWTRYYSDQIHQPLTYIINNTIITNGPRVAGMGQEYKMSLVINNINAMYCLPDGMYGEDWRSGGTHGWQTNFSANSGWETAMRMDSIRSNLFWKQDNVQTLFIGGYTYHNPPGGTGGNTSWADWTTHGGTGINADPLFVQHFGHEPNQSLLNGEITASSPVIGAGENLQPYLDFFYNTWGIVLPSTDLTGRTRDATNPSIGAYEYGVALTDTVPSFSFTALTGKELNTEYIATSAFPIAAVDSTFHIWTTTAAQFKINYNGTYNISMKTANPQDGQDTVYVKNMTGGSYSEMYTETIVAGGQSRNFDVTTKATPDSVPYFHFTDITNAELNSYHTAYAIFINADLQFHVSSADSFKVGLRGVWRKNGYQTHANSGDTVYVPNSASNLYLTTKNITVTAGSFSDIFSITTKSVTGGVGNGGWPSGSNGRKIYLKNSSVLITK